MKFEKRFFFSVIPEWKDQYIALESLLKQIEAIKNAALRLVQSIANIKKLDGNRVVEVDLHAIRPDKLFWEMLDENLQRIENFYETQLSSFLEQFHTLTLQAVLLNKIDDYIPFNPGQATKLERELGRLPNNKDVPIGVLAVDEQVHKPTHSSRFFHITTQTNIDTIKEQIRALKPTVNKLKRSTEIRHAHSPLASSRGTTVLRAHSLDGPSVEDHVRDFQFASAQLQQSQMHHHGSYPSDPPHPLLYPDYPLSSDSSLYYPYAEPTSGPAPRGNSHYSYSSNQRDQMPLTGRESVTHSRISSRSEIDARMGAELNSQIPSYYYDPRSADSAKSRPENHPSTSHPSHDIDWGKDEFFQSSESDRDVSAAMSRSGSTIVQAQGNLRRSHSDDDDDDMMAVPRVRLNRPPNEAPASGRHSPPKSVSSAKKGDASGYSSFFSSEDDLSDHEMAGKSSDLRSAHLDSDGASQASKDSGYDSGNSYEGFADDIHNDEQEEPRKPKKAEISDTETTGSRHQHVPETRLRTRKRTESKLKVPPTGSSGMGNQMVSSASAPNLPQLTGSSSYSMKSSQSPRIDGEERVEGDRAGSTSQLEVRPLLSVPGTPVLRKKHRDRLRQLNEVEMSPMRSNGGANQDSELLPLDAEMPDLLPISDDGRDDGDLVNLDIEDDELAGARNTASSSNSGKGRNSANSNNQTPGKFGFLGGKDVFGGPNGDDEQVMLDLGEISSAPPRTTFYQMPDPRNVNRDKALKGLQNGFSELYRGMHLLKRYAELNVEATDKVLAKYEKNIARGFRLPFMREEILNYNFAKGQELRLLISQTEYVYAQAFTGGHRTPAMQKLRVPEEEEDMEATTLRFGLLFGLSLGFALIILYMCIVVTSSVVQKMRPDLIVYRMLFIATLMLWYWGVDMWIWSAHRVNYPFIFEFNTRGHMRHQNIFDIASIFTVVLIGDMMLYMLSALQRYDSDFVVPGFELFKHVPPESYPLVLVLTLLGLFLFYSVRSGFWLVRTLGRIVTAPLYKVVFRDFFMADQLVSITLVLQDIDFTICYFTTCAFRGGGNQCATNHMWMSAILSTVPQLWRLLQCLRRYYDSKDMTQLYNAGKYTTGMLVAICSSMRSIVKSRAWLVLWLIFVIVATVYSYGWDIYKDWSIGDRKSPNWMLRDQLLYPKWWYYVAAIVNLVLRLMWTLTISPDVVAAFFFLGKDGFTTLLVSVEVSRRAMWNIFRLENEQLNNCGKFRAVQDIPLPLPLKPAVEENLYQDKIK